MNTFITSLKRTPYQSLATFTSLALTLFLSTVLLFTIIFLYGLLGYIETRPQVAVYFRTQTSEDDIFRLRDSITSTGKVLSIKYISKSEAFALYKELNKDNPLLLEMVSEDMLPASLEIYAKKPQYLPEIAEMVKTKPGVEEVDYQRVVIERLTTLTGIVRKSWLAFFIFLIFNAVVTLITIGHFKIALRKDEIELLRFLGASRWYIRKPFLKESVIFGLISSVFSFGIFFAIIGYLSNFISSYLRGIPSISTQIGTFTVPVWPFHPYFFAILFLLVSFSGVVIACFSTLLATQKYLK